MMVRAILVVLGGLLGACRSEGADLEMRLKSQHNKLLLRVTVYASVEAGFEWREICCRANNAAEFATKPGCEVEVKPENYVSSTAANSTALAATKEAPANFIYQLIIEKNGFVECSYENVTSNLLFFRMENYHMYMVKIKQDEDELMARTLQMLVMDEFQVMRLAPQKNVYHLTYKSYGPMSETNDVKYFKTLEKLLKNQSVEVFSTKYCMPLHEDALHLPTTPYGRVVVPKVDFLQENATPFSVHCRGGFYEGVFWDKEDLRNFQNQPRIYDTNITSRSNLTSLNTPFKIQTFCDKLGELNLTKLEVIGTQFNSLVNSSLLEGMKRSLNTSNQLLDFLDRALVGSKKEANISQVVQPRFAASVQDISSAKATAGFAIFKFTDQGVNYFSKNETQNIITDAPSVAILLPDSLLVKQETDQKVAVAVFKESAALFDAGTDCSPVISVTIGARSIEQLEDPLKIWFSRDVRKYPNAGVCMSWDFKANGGIGGWTPYGCRLVGSHMSTTHSPTAIDECACWHMTHFGEIFWDSDQPFFSPEHTEHESLLNFVTFVGCILSLAGLTGVFLTAIISPSWLAGPGQKIQLQMSVNLALLILLFMLLTSKVTLPKAVCSLFGALLHYVMLSNFSWMLLAAYLQYSRLVTVVRKRSSRLLLKSGVLGWGLPLIPVLLSFITGNFKLYSGPPLCLPSGDGFYLTIFAPLLAIVSCNVVVFILIARSLFQTIEIRRHDVGCLNSVRFKQLFFLFVLLGLSWIFALMQVLLPELRYLFSYLFCICIGSQGLVYFIFFVMMDAKASSAWTRPFRASSIKYDVHRLTRRAGLIYSSRTSSSYSSTGSRAALDINAVPL